MSKETVFSWLIEKNDGGGQTPEYWDGRGAASFSNDPNTAIRFAQKHDALTVLYWVLSDKGRAFCRITEHGFLQKGDNNV